jgi:hypothetical protein
MAISGVKAAAGRGLGGGGESMSRGRNGPVYAGCNRTQLFYCKFDGFYIKNTLVLPENKPITGVLTIQAPHTGIRPVSGYQAHWGCWIF